VKRKREEERDRDRERQRERERIRRLDDRGSQGCRGMENGGEKEVGRE
jgi:hypothetical protein